MHHNGVNCQATTTDLPVVHAARKRTAAFIAGGLAILSFGIVLGAIGGRLLLSSSIPALPAAHRTASAEEGAQAAQKREIQRLEERKALIEKTREQAHAAFLFALQEGYRYELIIEDGTALTVKNNRAALGDKTAGFYALHPKEYPVIAYRVHRDKTMGYGIAGDPAEMCFPFVWMSKQHPAPAVLRALELSSGRDITER